MGPGMSRCLPTTRLLLVLAPLLGLTPACDKSDPEPGDKVPVADPDGDSESAGSTMSPTEGDDSETDSEGEDSETDSDGTTSEPLPPDDECGEWLVGMTPDEILAARPTSESWGEPDSLEWCAGEHSMPCTTAEGAAGTSLCVSSWGQEEWTTCAVEHACTPDSVFDAGECQGTYCAILEGVLTVDEWISDDPCCGTDDPCCWTPLVVSFDGEPIRFEAAGAAAFDISGQGACLSTATATGSSAAAASCSAAARS
jgi:hypothetical protein